MDQSIDAWLLLNASGLTTARQLQLLEALGSPDEILGATDQRLTEVEGITQAHVKKLRAAQQQIDLTELHQECAEHQSNILTIADESYPALLKEIDDPPPVLFVQGGFTKADELALAVVGTRKCTPYGRTVARELATNLAQRGFTIVSGLAVGIDGEAHEAALEAGGRTIAVLACGADITYPREHRQLREKIAQSGAVITECPFGTPPTRERFPMRNRLISGLSLGTVVVEAPSKSGALITAGLAGEQGREVFAVPGDINSPTSRGCHGLIKDGAQLVEVPEDVVDGLGIMLRAVPAREQRQDVELHGDEETVYQALSHQPRHADEIAESCEISPAQVTSALMLLEVKGLVRRFAGNTYVRLN